MSAAAGRLKRLQLNEYVRISVYLEQSGRGYLTARQLRRVLKKWRRDEKRGEC